MAQIRTNLMEHLLREILIGIDVYVSGTTSSKINILNYQPLTHEVFITCANSKSYIIAIDDWIDIEFNKYNNVKIKPTSGKIKGKIKL